MPGSTFAGRRAAHPPHAQSRATPAAIEARQVGWLRPDGSPLWPVPLTAVFSGGRTGIVGANGAGKTVLLELLTGRRTVSGGTVQRTGRWHMVAQDAPLAPDGSVAALAGLAGPLRALARLESGQGSAHDLELAAGHWDLPARLRQALHEAGWHGDDLLAPAGLLSDGMRTRVALVGAWLSGADGLVLDEPTNHLDRAGRDWLARQLRRWTGPLVLVSHDREVLRQMDRIIELSARGLQLYGGNFEAYAAQRAAAAEAAEAVLAHAQARRAAVQRELKRRHDAEQRRMAQGRRAARGANLPRIAIGAMQARAEHTQARLRHLRAGQQDAADAAVRAAAQRVPLTPGATLALPASAVAPQQRVLTTRDLVCTHGSGQREPFTVSLVGPVRVAVLGPNGCGKTTLLRTLCGALPPAAGSATLHLPHAWLDQRSAAALAGPGRALDVLSAHAAGVPPAQLRTRLARLGLNAQVLALPASGLSGGERMRLALAATLWRREPPRLLLLDEPTNHLDLAAIGSLEDALADFPGALIVASHDADFIAALDCHVRWCWTPGGWVVADGNPGG